ncbi:MAG TPA: hypothetical protein VGG71_09085 [Chitinophagaceae bacterium]
MRQFIRNLLLFFISFLALVLVIILFETIIINHQGKFRLEGKEKYIFLGHSHAQMAYDDKIIDSALNQASSGEAYFYTYIKLKKILENNSDRKVVFVEYSNNNIVREMNDWIWDDIHILERYKLYTAYIPGKEFEFLVSKNPKSTLLCQIRSVINNAYYILRPKNIKADSMMGGYVYLVRDKTDSLLKASAGGTKKNTDTGVSYENIRYLKKIIDLCKIYGVQVYLIRSPLHPKYDGFANERDFEKLLHNDLNGAEFLDFKDYPLPDSDYGDLEHVNYRGAKKYSVFFNSLIKKGLLQQTDKQKFIDEQMAFERKNL